MVPLHLLKLSESCFHSFDLPIGRDGKLVDFALQLGGLTVYFQLEFL